MASRHRIQRAKENSHGQSLGDDAARFSLFIAVVASLAALYLAFAGPSRQHAVVFQQEWRISQSVEKAILSLPRYDNQVIVVLQDAVKLLEKQETSNSRYAAAQEIARTSILGRTRVAKGRNAHLICGTNEGLILATQTGIIMGLKITGNTIITLWETTLDKYIIESIFTHQNDSSAQTVILILARRKDENGDVAKFTLMALTSTNGNIAWSLETDETNSQGMNQDALGPYPIQPNERLIIQMSDTRYIVSFAGIAILVKVSLDRGTIEAMTRLPDAKKRNLRVDIDGDGQFEYLSVDHGTSEQCIRIRGEETTWKHSFLYSNCSEASEMAEISPDNVQAVIVQRERPKGGAVALHGNLTLTRRDARGYDVIAFNSRTGYVSCLRHDGTVVWSSSPVLAIASETTLKQSLERLWIFSVEEGEQLSHVVLAPFGKITTSYILVMGDSSISVLRAIDGASISSIDFGSTIVSGPFLNGIRATFILESGDVVSINFRSFRDYIPPLLLVPVMITLCVFWACFLWSRLEAI